jgi:LacI family transcriptional regulator
VADLTLEDIAKLVGVSRSTVSRVVNNHPNVSEDVRKRVIQAIQSTGYHPNVAARTLASQRSWMIGLVVPRNVSAFFTDPLFPYLIQGIAQACNQHDYTIGLFLVDTKEDEEKIIRRISRSSLLDGILVQAGHRGDQVMDRLIHSELPLVGIGRPFHPEKVSYIDIDNVNAAYDAVSHLIRLDHQRIGTITGPMESSVGVDRLEGYRLALIDHGRAINETLVAEGDFTETGGYYAMQRLLTAKPDAIFAASDIMAIGAMRAALEAGLHIPEDIAFIGFDDVPLGYPGGPLLTTVRQPFHQFGASAVEILLDIIKNGGEPPRRLMMGTELIVRESCGASNRRTDNRQ